MIRLNYHTYIKCWAHAEYIPCLPHEFLETLQKPVNHSHSGTVCLAHTPEATIKMAITPGVHKGDPGIDDKLGSFYRHIDSM